MSTDTDSAAVDELLELLSDAYACEILRELQEEPLSADDLVDRCSMSRPTVYRRLDALTDAGIVDATPRLAADGHHRREYRLSLASLSVRVDEDGIDGTVRTTSADRRSQ
ncbi:MAG: ArsR/SmtB family transcription factor [Halohasta sp.]